MDTPKYKTLDDFVAECLCAPKAIEMMLESSGAKRDILNADDMKVLVSAAIMCVVEGNLAKLLVQYDFPVVDFGAMRRRIIAGVESYLGGGHA